MEKTNMEIQIQGNIQNQFLLLRNNTFKDPLCFVDENVQNAQRAGAKNIQVHVDYDSIVFENDGEALDDHSVLFNMGASDWSEEVMESQTPFGLGFFSNLSVSDHVVITSGLYQTTYRFSDGKASILPIKNDIAFKGFKLEIFDYNTSKIDRSAVIDRVKQLGNYVQDVDVFVNHVKQTKINIGEGKGFAFEHLVKGEGYAGFIFLNHKSFFHNSGIDIFHNGRFVKKIENVFYVFGEIHIDNTVVNLESPDRKDIIQDDSFHRFIEELELEAKIMVENIIKTAPDEFVKANESAISYYADFTEASKNYSLNYIASSSKENSLIENLDQYALLIENKSFESIFDLEAFLKETENVSDNEVKDVSFMVASVQSKGYRSEEDKGNVINNLFDTTPNFEGDYSDLKEQLQCESDEIEETSERTSRYTSSERSNPLDVEKKKLELDKPSFWIEFKDIPRYKKNIDLAKKHNVIVYIVQNSFEKRLLMVQNTKMLQHIKELNLETRYDSHISNLRLSGAEQRASKLLHMISRMIGFEENVFVIGDVMVSETLLIPSLNYEKNDVLCDYNVIANPNENKVYVDRSIIHSSILDDSDFDTLTIFDIKFILLNIENIIKEVSLLDQRINKSDSLNKVLVNLALA